MDVLINSIIIFFSYLRIMKKTSKEGSFLNLILYNKLQTENVLFIHPTDKKAPLLLTIKLRFIKQRGYQYDFYKQLTYFFYYLDDSRNWFLFTSSKN